MAFKFGRQHLFVASAPFLSRIAPLALVCRCTGLAAPEYGKFDPEAALMAIEKYKIAGQPPVPTHCAHAQTSRRRPQQI
jgi:hypothetical protein